MITPLPRSLDPLPGELLACYVMRLAHRLGVAPDTVLRRTGLADYMANTQAITRTALSLELPAQQMRDFQSAARLTAAEVTALTLLPLAPRYPPVLHSLDVVRAGKRIPSPDWLFPTTARYCPDCLAGDGTTPQTDHREPWQIEWRLPVVFACPHHQRFLEHLCPACRRSIADHGVGQLIPRPTIPARPSPDCTRPSAEHPSTTAPAAHNEPHNSAAAAWTTRSSHWAGPCPVTRRPTGGDREHVRAHHRVGEFELLVTPGGQTCVELDPEA
ncbi:TniQ family protein [Streptomyces corynorhini]|uniref:TniQ domain-containing protein n=1 Tax=Streptomyces corynorhini TaxID=2282652 RepID=A0A370BF44_9ACTN|nr:TniQ family protein [Streptomyces corynorhini]RDG38065.1 hypothetical protein DVH02_11090 [Streptomyces corynorhini]